MSEFDGFPIKMRFTPVPNLVFSRLFPLITDINELKILFHIFAIVYPKKSSLRFTSRKEMLSEPGVMNSIRGTPQETLSHALMALTQKGIILTLSVKQVEEDNELYFLNTAANKRAIEQILGGEMALPGFEVRGAVEVNAAEASDVFTLYEQNVGMLTPLIADELREAKRQYPESWIKDAFKVAISLNKRNWRYIARILEHWSIEGKDDGTHRRNLKTITDPDKYIKGKYGHMVQR